MLLAKIGNAESKEMLSKKKKTKEKLFRKRCQRIIKQNKINNQVNHSERKTAYIYRILRHCGQIRVVFNNHVDTG